MLLFVFVASLALTPQTQEAPNFEEADVSRLETCVFGGDDMSKCGDFAVEVAALEQCAARTNLDDGPESFVEQWVECEGVLPCILQKPRPGQSRLALRNCSARGVASRKIIAHRWWPAIDARLGEADRQVLVQVQKAYLDQLEIPSESDDPLRASARQAGSWDSWLRFLRLAQITGKPTV
ncbi:hypothetical protein [Brevundimonas sp.]|jgi:hypothetical protein|uniref:hypothetical protein n=1 Tax=Brevundimonas sp. TaxID=1871086 RepID=UPI0025B97F77|nr:hypothetical protein [Brevundimonas sp.]